MRPRTRLRDPLAVASATKDGLLLDIENIRDRLGEMLKGNVKFLDAKHREVSQALKNISAASDLLMVGLIPTNKE